MPGGGGGEPAGEGSLFRGGSLEGPPLKVPDGRWRGTERNQQLSGHLRWLDSGGGVK